MAEYKNRIVGSGVEPLDAILFNQRNWRIHPLNQQNALKGVLEDDLLDSVNSVMKSKNCLTILDASITLRGICGFSFNPQIICYASQQVGEPVGTF